MKKVFFKGVAIAGIAALFVVIIPVSHAGHDEDFKQASNLDYYPGITSLQSAQLDVNLASVIHQENLQIIQNLQEIQDRLSKLEESVQTIEKQVVRK